MSPRNPPFEEAVEVMAGTVPEFIENVQLSMNARRNLATRALTALLDAKQTETCETCGGTGTIDGEPGNGYPHGNRVGCPGCGGAGRAPGTVPLVILAPVLAHPTVKIPNDVPGWEGVTLPAAYHDPLRDGEFQ